MSRRDFAAVVSAVADYFPPESVIERIFNEFSAKSADSVLDSVRATEQYRVQFPLIKPMLLRSIADVPDSQLCKDIIAIIDTYYPNVVSAIASNAESCDWLLAVIKGAINDVRSAEVHS